MSLFVTQCLPLIVLLPPFNGFSGQTVWIDGFTDAGVFVLLALGLNIVVGHGRPARPRLRGVLRHRCLHVSRSLHRPLHGNHIPFWIDAA